VKNELKTILKRPNCEPSINIFFFTHDLLTNVVRISDYMVLNNSTVVSNGLERMWKEDAMAKFEALPQHLAGRTEENHDLRLVDVSAEIQTKNPPNTSYCLMSITQ
jgi:ABC-type Mn2+/Zn2+ transport system ATPase subunit